MAGFEERERERERERDWKIIENVSLEYYIINKCNVGRKWEICSAITAATCIIPLKTSRECKKDIILKLDGIQGCTRIQRGAYS